MLNKVLEETLITKTCICGSKSFIELNINEIECTNCKRPTKVLEGKVLILTKWYDGSIWVKARKVKNYKSKWTLKEKKTPMIVQKCDRGECETIIHDGSECFVYENIFHYYFCSYECVEGQLMKEGLTKEEVKKLHSDGDIFFTTAEAIPF